MVTSPYTRALNDPEKRGTNGQAEQTRSCQTSLFYGILFRKLLLISGTGIPREVPKIEQETSAAASGYFVSLEKAPTLRGPGAWKMVPAAHVWEGARSFLQDAPVNTQQSLPKKKTSPSCLTGHGHRPAPFQIPHLILCKHPSRLKLFRPVSCS